MPNPFRPKMTTAKIGTVARYAHAKYDGHFVCVNRGTEDVLVQTSHPTDITDQLPLALRNSLMRLPFGCECYGELHVPGMPASCVKTALKEKWSELRIAFFALAHGIIQHGGMDSYVAASSDLEEVATAFRNWCLPFAYYDVRPEGPTTQEDIDQLNRLAVERGYEGWVLKTGNLTGWAKLKLEQTIDLVVVGAHEGNGKYLGQIGSLECAVYRTDMALPLWQHVASVGGMTDEQRVEMTHDWDNNQALRGRVVEVKYQRVDSQGRLRHPRFLRFRDDKQPTDCTLDQDEALADHWDRSRRFSETNPQRNLKVTRGEE